MWNIKFKKKQKNCRQVFAISDNNDLPHTSKTPQHI